MKKIISLLVLTVLLLSSISVAFAENDDNVVKPKNVRRMNIARDNFEDAKARFQEAKDNYHKNLVKFKETRDAIKEACDDENDNLDCDAVKAQAFEDAKVFLLNSADQAIAYLEKVKSRIEENENIPEEEAAEMLGKLDASISDLEAAKLDVEAATTKEELREAAKTIKDSWNDIKHHARRHAWRVVVGRLDGVIDRFENVEDKLECAVSALSEANVDTSVLDEKLNTYGEHLDSADSLSEQVHAVLSEIKSLGDSADPNKVRELLDKAKSLVKEAHSELRVVHNTMKDMLRIIHSSGVDVSECKLRGSDPNSGIKPPIEGEESQ
ncbi:MAG: hypothetical protein AABW49_01520 [Nanoarchaeota archaeon]